MQQLRLLELGKRSVYIVTVVVEQYALVAKPLKHTAKTEPQILRLDISLNLST